MKALAVLGAVGGVLAAGAVAAWLLLFSAPGTPGDRPPATELGLAPDEPLWITVLGTSLTARYDWPQKLRSRLEACLGRPVEVRTVADPGASVEWGAEQVEEVFETEPDLVLVEFAINDADITDGVSLSRARQLTRSLAEQLAQRSPVVLMTMSPAQGPRGWVRPLLMRHYESYAAIANETGAGLLDLYPRWLALPRENRGLQADGLHPDPSAVQSVLLPAGVTYVASLAGKRCTTS